MKSILQPFDSFFDSICLPTWKPSGKVIVNKEFLDRIEDWKFSNLNVEDLPQHNGKYFTHQSNEYSKKMWTSESDGKLVWFPKPMQLEPFHVTNFLPNLRMITKMKWWHKENNYGDEINLLINYFHWTLGWKNFVPKKK